MTIGSLVTAALVLVVAVQATAQTVTVSVMHRFAKPYTSAGELLPVDDGYLGIFANGGPSDCGAVFKLTPDGAGGYALSILHDFDCTDGAHPVGALLSASDGNVYGVTNGQSGSVRGTVFRVSRAGVVTTVHAFEFGEGYGPTGLVEGLDSALYGINSNPGATSANTDGYYGTVFRVALSGDTTVLHTFTPPTEAQPQGKLSAAANGSLYGVMSYGGSGNPGGVFEIDSSGTFRVVHHFVAADGSGPSGVIRANDGLLYGTMYRAGANNCGAVYRVDPVTGALTNIYAFPWSSSSGCYNGAGPTGGVIQARDGRLYGMTDGFYSGVYGNIYVVGLDGSFSLLHTFDSSSGGKPTGGLEEDRDGLFVGTTSLGGVAPNANGAALRVSASGQFEVLAGFQTADEGYWPLGGVTFGADGWLYGTTNIGGANGGGTIFRLQENGPFETLRPLTSATDGAQPYGHLTLASDGRLYGTTFSGGASQQGTLFSVTAGGAFSRVFSFPSPQFSCSNVGGGPLGGVIEGADGNLYGATNVCVTVFRRDGAGAVSLVHSFPSGVVPAEGSYIYDSLAQGSDGRLYGAARDGGVGYGTVFAIDPTTGTLTVLHSFSGGSDGDKPYAGLVAAPDGSLYGSTTAGGCGAGIGGGGVIYRIDPAGPSPFTVVHTFSCDGAEGGEPFGKLLVGRDGKLYGTTRYGGASQGRGTIFRVSPGGVFETLHVFHGADGAEPMGELVQTPDGRFYGATYGPTGGEVYSMSIIESTSLAADSVTASYAGTATLSATLTSDGAPVADMPVSFSLNGVLAGFANTNAAGVAEISGVSVAGLMLGTYPDAVGATFDGAASYGSASATALLTVVTATPVISWLTPADIGAGTPLDAAQLNATADVAGVFTYAPPAGTVLPIGSGQTLTALFTPADTVDYTSVSASVTINVTAPVGPAISLSTTSIDFGPGAIGVFNAPTTITVTNAGNAPLNISAIDVSPEFSYGSTFCLGYTIAPGDSCTIPGVAFIPAQLGPRTGTLSLVSDAAGSPHVVSLTGIGRVRPTIDWPVPAAIAQGTPLGATQLNATADAEGPVSGRFAYTPAAGAVLPAGIQTLSVTFIPDDQSTYLPATRAVTIVVSEQSYAVIDLGTLGGSSSSAAALNASGQVSGSSATADGASHAFLYSAGTMTDLGTLGGWESQAQGINAAGQVVGSSETATGATHAFVTADDVMTDLGTLAGGDYSDAYAINAGGQVVGRASLANGSMHAFLYDNGTMIDLGSPNGQDSYAYAINDAGDVAGAFQFPIEGGATTHAFLYHGGAMTDIGTLGGAFAVATAINAAGQVFGLSLPPGDSTIHFFRYSDGLMQDLGPLGGSLLSDRVNGVNAAGTVAGQYGSGFGSTAGYILRDAAFLDLRALVPIDADWTRFLTAAGINDAGLIAGTGVHNGELRAFLMGMPPAPIQPPIAALTATPSQCACQQVVQFDGSTSQADPRRAIVNYAWDFGDGTAGAGSTPTHAYARYGTYTVTLTVTDDSVPPQVDTTSATVTVDLGHRSPMAVPGGPYAFAVDAPVSYLDATASLVHPDAACGAIVNSFVWTTDDALLLPDNTAAPMLTAAQLATIGVGSHTISLTVTDQFGSSSTASTTLAVTPALVATATTVMGSPNPVVFGSPVTMTATVTPSTARGRVTFYAGTIALGDAPVVDGQATLTSTLLPAGAVAVSARYVGDDSTSLSALWVETVVTRAAGGFVPAAGTPINVGANPEALALGDFNNDGIADVVVSNGDTVSVLLGDGTGGFAPTTGSPLIAGVLPVSVAVGDFTNDGNADIAVASYGSSGGNGVSILTGDGHGGFVASGSSPIAAGTTPNVVAAGDFNGDGALDLVVSDYLSGSISTWLGDGNGGLAQVGSSVAVAYPTALIVGDFNGDRVADVAATSYTGNAVTVLLGDGSGSLVPFGASIAVGLGPRSITAGDVDGDGYLDLVAANGDGNSVIVLRGDGVGGFAETSGSPLPASGPSAVALGDFNADGHLDVVVANGSDLAVWLGDGHGVFAPSPANPVTAGSWPVAVAVGDFDGDGIPDLTIANNLSADVSVLLGVGSPIAQTIAFSPLANLAFGSAPFTLNATASSGLAVSFASTTPAVCAVAGNTVTLTAVGTCSIEATQSGNAAYLAAPAVTRSFQVSRGSQTITFDDPANRPYGSAPFFVSAISTSGLTVSFESTTPAICSVTENVVTLLAVGACGIRATQDGDANYLAAHPVTRSFQVTKATQTIAFGPLPDVQFGSAPFEVNATASSGLLVSITSTTPGVCTAVERTVTLVRGGTCTLRANQSGDASYLAAAAVKASFEVTPAPQTIAFGALADQVFGLPPFTVSATASSGLSVSFTSVTPTVCNATGATVRLLAGGACTIQASQAGNVSYQAAPSVMQSFQVTPAAQTIAFGAVPDHQLGTAPFHVAATASSGLPVSFASTTVLVCTVSGNTVAMVSAGTCGVLATQQGSDSYQAAPAVLQTFTVTPARQTIAFAALPSQTFGVGPFSVSATASSGLPVSFASTTMDVCTISDATVTVVGAGTCAIQATQAGNANYLPAPVVNRSFTVAKASQTIAFEPLSSQSRSVATVALTAMASSGLPVSFTSTTATVCTVSGSTVTLIATGTCGIRASQPGDVNYRAAPAVAQRFTVAP
jgi:probable HAF family extracellular repeat protein/uncharacterized repeat protein (TIGR03803 family)